MHCPVCGSLLLNDTIYVLMFGEIMCGYCHQWIGEFEGDTMTAALKPKRREITLILDKSGSMYDIIDDTESGVRAFLDSQRDVPGDTRVTLVEFSNSVETVYRDIPLAEVPDYTLRPHALTALLDAIGSTISEAQSRFIGLPPERQPDEVVFVVFTDGKENRSRDWTVEAVRNLVQAVRLAGWVVYFMGADEDSIQVAGSMGVDPATSVSFEKGNAGHSIATAGASVARGSRTGSYVVTDQERAEMTGTGDVLS